MERLVLAQLLRGERGAGGDNRLPAEHRERPAFVRLGAAVTFAQLDDGAARVAAGFAAAGLHPGDRVLLLIPNSDAETLCRLLGVVPRTEVGDSALREIGNILGASYLNALSAITGLELAPGPPRLSTDGPAALFSGQAATPADSAELVLVLDSVLHVAELPCSISFLLLPTAGGVSELLAPLGLADGR